jgi:hypothetical protein
VERALEHSMTDYSPLVLFCSSKLTVRFAVSSHYTVIPTYKLVFIMYGQTALVAPVINAHAPPRRSYLPLSVPLARYINLSSLLLAIIVFATP